MCHLMLYSGVTYTEFSLHMIFADPVIRVLLSHTYPFSLVIPPYPGPSCMSHHLPYSYTLVCLSTSILSTSLYQFDTLVFYFINQLIFSIVYSFNFQIHHSVHFPSSTPSVQSGHFIYLHFTSHSAFAGQCFTSI